MTPELAGIVSALGASPRGVAQDSRAVSPGDLFLAFPGERADGRKFIGQAIARGASAVLWESDRFEWPSSWHLPNAGVAGLRRVAGAIAADIYGHPSQDLWVAGVTGTNGKTSCTQWIAQAMGRCGRAAAVMGTLGNGFPGALDAGTHTTPDPVSVQRELRRLRDAGAQAVAMEVSSHALDQGRVDEVRFATALFTNLTRDHLDYHGTMAAYGAAKARLFGWPDLANAVVNLDDEFGRDLVTRIDGRRTRVLGYGIGHGDLAAHDVRLTRDGVSATIRSPWGEVVVRSPVIGGFNVSNLLGTFGVLMSADLPLEEVGEALSAVAPVAGRLEILRHPGAPLVVVDYAHTPDALEKVLETLRELVGHEPGARLVCVFGCGGERDAGKRPVMGEIATRLADDVVITSDNPRGEDPEAIVAEVVAGAGPNHRAVVDREQAIATALRAADARDVVLIAGKGHETYQEVAGVRRPFDDREVAYRFLRGRGGPLESAGV